MISKPHLIAVLIVGITITATFAYSKLNVPDWIPPGPSITPTPTPVLPTPVYSVPPTSFTPMSTPYQGFTDTRSWPERLKDPRLPEILDINWQTYINSEYNFSLRYPKEWAIKEEFWESTDPTSPKITGKVFTFYLKGKPYKSFDDALFMMTIYKGYLLDELKRSSYWVNRINNSGLSPDVTSNYIPMYLLDDYKGSTSQETILGIMFSQGDYVYSMGESFSTGVRDKAIIEYIVKTFHF